MYIINYIIHATNVKFHSQIKCSAGPPLILTRRLLYYDKGDDDDDDKSPRLPDRVI